MRWDVIVEGIPVEHVVDVRRRNSDEDILARSTVEVANTAENRSITSGDTVDIRERGETIFEGNVVKKPSKGDDGELLEFVVADRRAQLFYEDVHRPFYDMDTGAIIREAVNHRAQQLEAVTIHRGSSLSNWSSDAHVFELADFPRGDYQEYGSDLIFVGWREGASDDYVVRFDNVPSRAIPGSRQIMRFQTRLLVNNTGRQFTVEVELVDQSGANYIWTIDNPGTDFETHELRPEDARNSANIGSEASGTGVLEYRFDIKGDLSEPRAALIDHADTLPFSLHPRDSNVTVDGVQDTGRTISRRFDENIMEMLNTLTTEDGFMSYIDSEMDLHYEPAGQTFAPFDINDETTPVVGYDIDRDYDRITNRVTVQGARDIQVIVSDNASIQFYGLSSREDAIVDDTIQTQREARQRGEKELEDLAWHDSALSFEIADRAFEQVRVGELIPISWNDEDIDGEYIVSETQTDETGIVTIKATGSTEAVL